MLSGDLTGCISLFYSRSHSLCAEMVLMIMSFVESALINQMM